MEYTRLGSSDLRVSRICLGTVFRSEPDEAACLSVVQEAADQGVNFLDCANIYRAGYSEKIVGKALQGRRAQFIVTTKVGSETSDNPPCKGLTSDAIMRAVEASLRRLQTDYIDLYLCHIPDPQTPIEETLCAMDSLVRQGKVRYAGCSNFEGWRLCEALMASDLKELVSFVCHQLEFNLLDRRMEDEVIPFCRGREIGITVFAPTAIGLLTGRFRHGRPPPPDTSWFRGPYNYRAAMTSRTGKVIDTVVDIANRNHKTPAQVAMAWCLSRPGVSCVITGADTPERVRENCGAIGWDLDENALQRLDSASQGSRMVIRKDCPEGYQD